MEQKTLTRARELSARLDVLRLRALRTNHMDKARIIRDGGRLYHVDSARFYNRQLVRALRVSS